MLLGPHRNVYTLSHVLLTVSLPLMISNARAILNLRHLKCLEALFGPKVLISKMGNRCPRGTVTGPRSLPVFVKARLLLAPQCLPQPIFVALVLPGGWTSWPAGAFALFRSESCCVNSAAATEKILGSQEVLAYAVTLGTALPNPAPSPILW